MSYTPTNWVNGQTPINAENLNKIEQQLKSDSETLAKHAQDIAKSSEDLGKLEKEFEENLSKTLETVESDLNEVKQEVGENTEKLSELEQMLADKLYYEQKVESVGYSVDNPDHSAKSAKISMIGGTTKKSKNLIPYPYYETTKTVNGITFTDNGDGTVTANGTAEALATFITAYKAPVNPGEYILTGCPEGGGSSLYSLRVTHGDNTKIDDEYGEGVNITISSETSDGLFRVICRVSSGVTVEKLTFKPMLRLATDTDETYEPYFSGLRSAPVTEVESVGENVTHSLPIPEAVQALDGYGDGISDTVYNYVDFEKKRFVKRVVKKVFDGSETWRGSGGNGTDTAYYVYELGAYGTVVNHSALCNKFEQTGSISGSTTNIGYRLFNSDGFSSAIFSVRPENSATLTAATMKELVAEWYAAGNPLVICYELATPEITDISNLLTDNLVPIEGGGTLTFKNEYKYAVPNTVVYSIDVIKKLLAHVETA